MTQIILSWTILLIESQSHNLYFSPKINSWVSWWWDCSASYHPFCNMIIWTCLYIFVHVYGFMFVNFHPFYFSNQFFPILIFGPWSPYTIMHKFNMSNFTQYPHPPEMVYINHKIKLTIPSYEDENIDYMAMTRWTIHWSMKAWDHT